MAQPDGGGPRGDDVLGFPHKIQLQTYDSCNFKCGSCPYPVLAPGKPRTRMDAPLLTRIIDEVRAVGRRVRLCLMLQNEPLLDRRFVDLLAEAHAADDAIASISTVTNGSMLDAELLDRLVGFERFHLTISVNANDRERFRQLHGVDLWERLSGLLRTWPGARERVTLSFVVERESVPDARTFWARWRAEGYQTRLLPILSRAGLVQLAPGRRAAEDDFGHCHYPVDTLTVLANGDVIVCCQDWEHHETFGNLHEQSISEIWTSPRLMAIREAAIAGKIRDASATCRGCEYPMRSAVRMQLEEMVGNQVGRAGSGGVVEHAAQLRIDGGATIPAVVYEIDHAAGAISCVVDGNSLPDRNDVTGAFAIGIAQGEWFAFGSLAPLWCAARVRKLGVLATDGAVAVTAVRLELDRNAEVFRLLPWYAADWRSDAATDSR